MTKTERIEELLPYVRANSELIKLYKWDARRSDGKPLGKTPIGKKWGAKPALDEEVLREVVDKGFNIGYRMQPEDLVVDVDIRNFDGEDSLVKLCRDIGVDDLSEEYPTVLTGGGGFHFYMLLPEKVSVRHTLSDYPGIEFKTKGRQVVAAGSKHPSGNYYVWEEWSPALSERKRAPEELLKLIQREEYDPNEGKGKGWGELSAEKLGEILSGVPVVHFGSNDQWEPLMMACHHATGGEGEEEFLHWSLQDKEYSGDEHLIRNRWESLGRKDNGITIGTLHILLKPYGINVAEEVRREAADEFKDYIEEYEEEYGEEGGDESGVAIEIAEKLSKEPTNKELKQAVRAAENAGAIEKTKAKEIIRGKMNMPKREFGTLIKEVLDEDDKLPPSLETIMSVLGRKGSWDFVYDAFLDEVLCKAPGDGAKLPYNDQILTEVRLSVSKHVGIGIGGKEAVRDCIDHIAHQSTIDSAQNWIKSLEWDGVERVDRFCKEYLKGNEGRYGEEYLRELSRYIWTGLANRVLVPGCQLDILPVFYGEQGCGKSTAVKTMCPRAEAFVEISFTRNEETITRMMRGKLIGEVAELNGLHSREAEHIKAFATKTHEEWVPKYKEVAVRFPRRLMMIGTTNEEEFLSDGTGNRRWAPVEVGYGGEIDREKIKRDRKQLWAEAREIFEEKGQRFEGLEGMLGERQKGHNITDVWEDNIKQWLDEWDISEGFTINQLLESALDMRSDRHNRSNQMRVARVLKGLNYERKRIERGGARHWKWFSSS